MGRISLLRAPAIKALLIQLFACLFVLALARYLPAEWRMTIAVAALLQGAVAMSLSRLCRLAPWWLAIQAAFPLALIAALSLRLPPVIFLVGFVALLGLYWSTFRTQVPFYPSRLPVWRTVEDLLPKNRPVRFIDIGSGLGGLVLHLSQARSESAFAGIEIAPLPWLVSRLRGRLARSGSCFVRGDYECLDFASYDVIFAYLSPAAMPALWRKAKSEMRSGALLLSYEFEIPGIAPHIAIAPADGGPVLYGWHM